MKEISAIISKQKGWFLEEGQSMSGSVSALTNIKGFLETTFLDWPGRIASVLFLAHCNFRCPYCHNHSLVLKPAQLPNIPLEEVLTFLKRNKGWIDGIVISGGEPTIYKDLPVLIEQFKALGLAVKLDTNGTNPLLLERLIGEGLIDYVALDVKAPLDPERYGRMAGREVEIEPIRESIGLLQRKDMPYEFRTTLVPSLLSRQDILRLAEEIKGSRRYVLQNFNPQDPLDPELKRLNPFTREELTELSQQLKPFFTEIRVSY